MEMAPRPKVLIEERRLEDNARRRIMWGIIKSFESEGLSYQQAVELLEDTKGQLKSIPIKILSQ